jgi:hypothetical protein
VWEDKTDGYPACYAGSNDENPSVIVFIKGSQGLTHQKYMSLNVDCIANVPVLDGWIIQISEVRESGVTLQEVSLGMYLEIVLLTALEMIT